MIIDSSTVLDASPNNTTSPQTFTSPKGGVFEQSVQEEIPRLSLTETIYESCFDCVLDTPPNMAKTETIIVTGIPECPVTELRTPFNAQNVDTDLVQPGKLYFAHSNLEVEC